MKSVLGPLSLTPSYGPDGVMDVKALLHARKRVVRVIIAVGLVLLSIQRSWWPVDSVVYELVTRFGALFIALCIVGRTWVWVHLGRRRNRWFVSDGPYSVVRHPLYASSLIGVAGVGAQSGSIVVTLMTVLAVWAIFNHVARLEEADMASRFGEPYADYLRRTRRFLPRPSLWTPASSFTVERRSLAKGFANASLFALAIPVSIAIEWAQRNDLLPVLLRLP